MPDERLSEMGEHTVLHDDDLMPIQDSQTNPVTPKRVKISTLKTTFGEGGSSGGGSLPDFTPIILDAIENGVEYTESDNNSIILVTYTGAKTTVWLKSADYEAMDGVIFTIKKVGTVATVEVKDLGGNLIDGVSAYVFTTQYQSVTLRARYDGVAGQGVWDVISSHTP